MSILKILKKYYFDTKKWITNTKHNLNNKQFLLNFILGTYKVITIMTIMFLFGRIINFSNKKSEWQLYTIYDRNNKIMATDVYQIYIQKQPNIVIDSNFLKSYLTQSQIEDLLNNKPVPIHETIPKTPGIIQYKSKKRIFQKYITSIAYSDINRGIKKGLDLLASKSNIYTTIDLTLQTIVGKIVDEGTTQMNADIGFAFIVNMDGEIEAMYTTDAKNSNGIVKDFIHPVFTLYEFGSTLKPLTVFTGLFWEKITLYETFNIFEGSYLGDRRMVDEDPISPVATVLEILKMSSNVGTTLIAKKIGHKLLFNTFKMLNLMNSISTDFSTSISPKIPKNIKPVDIYSMSIGYSLNTNILNMLTAYLMIFNDGKLVKPHLFKKTKKTKQNTIFSKNPNIKKICQDTIKAMRQPASRHPILLSFNCAGKTGTANRMMNGTYNPEYVNTFCVCVIPNRYGQYKKLLIFGLMNPKPAKLAGLTVRRLIVDVVKQIGPLIY